MPSSKIYLFLYLYFNNLLNKISKNDYLYLFQDQISILNALAEDIHCRYSLACTKLRELLSPLLDSETPNMAHMQHFFKLTKELHRSYHPSVDAQRILAAFHVS